VTADHSGRTLALPATHAYPWAATPCPFCGRAELARHPHAGLMCLACGAHTAAGTVREASR
jgi:ribosomal protein L37AE/L43A